MRRRELIAGLGGLTAALAGCTGSPGGSNGADGATTGRTTAGNATGTRTRTRSRTTAARRTKTRTAAGETRTGRTTTERAPKGETPVETTTPTPSENLGAVHPVGTVVVLPSGDRLGVKSVAVRDSIVYKSMYRSRFAGPEGYQFVVADVVRPDPEDYDDPEWAPVELRIPDRSYTEGIDRAVENFSRPSGARRRRALFAVPTDLRAESGSMYWPVDGDAPDQEFSLDDAHLRALRLQPSFTVESVSVGDRARGGTRRDVAVDVSVTVSNDGERGGTFVGLLSLPSTGPGRDYFPSKSVELPVGRGETATWSKTVQWDSPPADTGSVEFEWSGDTHTEAVSFEDVPDGS